MVHVYMSGRTYQALVKVDNSGRTHQHAARRSIDIAAVAYRDVYANGYSVGE
jgi:hypothetical protein